MNDPGQRLEEHGTPGLANLEGQVRVFAVRRRIVLVKAAELPEQVGRHHKRCARDVVHLTAIRFLGLAGSSNLPKFQPDRSRQRIPPASCRRPSG